MWTESCKGLGFDVSDSPHKPHDPEEDAIDLVLHDPSYTGCSREQRLDVNHSSKHSERRMGMPPSQRGSFVDGDRESSTGCATNCGRTHELCHSRSPPGGLAEPSASQVLYLYTSEGSYAAPRVRYLPPFHVGYYPVQLAYAQRAVKNAIGSARKPETC